MRRGRAFERQAGEHADIDAAAFGLVAGIELDHLIAGSGEMAADQIVEHGLVFGLGDDDDIGQGRHRLDDIGKALELGGVDLLVPVQRLALIDKESRTGVQPLAVKVVLRTALVLHRQRQIGIVARIVRIVGRVEEVLGIKGDDRDGLRVARRRKEHGQSQHY